MKKAQSLSLTTVIVAALALLVLVILTMIFAGRMGTFNQGLKNCDTLCTTSSDSCIEAGYELAGFYGSCKDPSGTEIKEGAYCCKAKSS